MWLLVRVWKFLTTVEYIYYADYQTAFLNSHACFNDSCLIINRTHRYIMGQGFLLSGNRVNRINLT